MTSDAPSAHDVLRAVLLRSELIDPTRVDQLVVEILRALGEAGLPVAPVAERHVTTADLDMLDRWGRRE